MRKLRVSDDGRHFCLNGQPFFYLADTAWSAFTNASMSDWKQYLARRRMQGFNVVQVNILPQWDRSLGCGELEPCAKRGDGRWDWSHLCSDYFERAEAMVAAAWDMGLRTSLVLLWCNYVPGTWGAEQTPEMVMPFDCIQSYVETTARRFARYNPLYMVSGDTNFASPESVECYMEALQALKQTDPDALATLHLQPNAVVPEVLVDSPQLDFYMFQSGHGNYQALAYELTQQFLDASIRRPVVNGEPCYEGIGYFKAPGRFSAEDVRRASWQSVMSGASAGVAYGAHGIWSWHQDGMAFPAAGVWNSPFIWHEALNFQGALDSGYLRWLAEQYRLIGLHPWRGHADPPLLQVLADAKGSPVALYVPYAVAVSLQEVLDDRHWHMIHLTDRSVHPAKLQRKESMTVIEPAPFNSDYLLVAARN